MGQLLRSRSRSGTARIVNVNAGLYVNGEADIGALPTGENFNRIKTYVHTKLCNVLFTVEMAKRLEGSGVTINALHPGVINTDLGNFTGFLALILKFVKHFWRTPQEGGQPVAFLATNSALNGVNGKYFDLTKETPLSGNATMSGFSEELWALTEALVAQA